MEKSNRDPDIRPVRSRRNPIKNPHLWKEIEELGRLVTGQRSDQLSYVPKIVFNNLDLCHIESGASQLSLFSPVSTLSLLWTRF